MDMARIDQVIPAATTEIWTVTNNVYAHNFHILRHEDAGKMRQFVLVTPGTEAGVPTTVPAMGHHGQHG